MLGWPVVDAGNPPAAFPTAAVIGQRVMAHRVPVPDHDGGSAVGTQMADADLAVDGRIVVGECHAATTEFVGGPGNVAAGDGLAGEGVGFARPCTRVGTRRTESGRRRGGA